MINRTRVIIVIGALILQPFVSALFPTWFALNLNLCLLIVMGVILEPDQLVVPASLIFVSALIIDMYYNQYVGASVISLVLVLLFLLFARRFANIENPLFAAMVVIGANIVFYITFWIVYAALGSPYSFIYMIKKLPGNILGNAVVSFVAVFIASRGIIQRRRDTYFR